MIANLILISLTFLLSSCGLVLTDNYLSEKNYLELPSVDILSSSTDNLDKTDFIKKEMKFDNLPAVVSLPNNAGESFMFAKTSNFFDFNLSNVNTNNISALDKYTIPFVKYESLPDVKVSLPIKKPTVKPKVPLLDD